MVSVTARCVRRKQSHATLGIQVHSWNVTFLSALSGILCLALSVEAAQQIGWRDLTIPVDVTDDPYFGLGLEQRNSLDTLIRSQNKRQAGYALADTEIAAERSAFERLSSEALDGPALLEKEASFRDKLLVQRTAVREEWDDRDIKIPGYLIPLDFDDTKVVKFLLVPYAGACIHTPPPPANQMLVVDYEEGFPLHGLFTPVWVTGRLYIERSEQAVGLSDGTAAFEVGYAVDATQVVNYR